ncbi:hypothetical protein N0V90_008446 [Kalmusia sp. IMI 367209]|nr:hypothetical protein N0V90_008446 [Kalmusia sp. IMI 367209]
MEEHEPQSQVGDIVWIQQDADTSKAPFERLNVPFRPLIDFIKFHTQYLSIDDLDLNEDCPICRESFSESHERAVQGPLTIGQVRVEISVPKMGMASRLVVARENDSGEFIQMLLNGDSSLTSDEEEDADADDTATAIDSTSCSTADVSGRKAFEDPDVLHQVEERSKEIERRIYAVIDESDIDYKPEDVVARNIPSTHEEREGHGDQVLELGAHQPLQPTTTKSRGITPNVSYTTENYDSQPATEGVKYANTETQDDPLCRDERTRQQGPLISRITLNRAKEIDRGNLGGQKSSDSQRKTLSDTNGSQQEKAGKLPSPSTAAQQATEIIEDAFSVLVLHWQDIRNHGRWPAVFLLILIVYLEILSNMAMLKVSTLWK